MSLLIVLGHNPEGFCDEEIVGHIWMNKDDIDVCFNLWINLKIIDSWL